MLLVFDEQVRINCSIATASVRCGNWSRPEAARFEPLQSARRVTSEMFVAGFAADAELFTQVGQRKPVRLIQYNESIEFFLFGLFCFRASCP